MFESLSDRLGKIFDGIRGRGALADEDVEAALREVRTALLEADVSLGGPRLRRAGAERADGQVTKSVTPGQQVVKIVHDALIDMLGASAGPSTSTPPRRRRS